VPAHAGWRFPKHKGFMDIAGHVPGFSKNTCRGSPTRTSWCALPPLAANKDGVDLTDLARRIAAGAFDRWAAGRTKGDDEPPR
jgi:hypothetical protein